MRRASICSVAALVVLWAGSMAMAKATAGQKDTTQKTATTKDATKPMTPQERRLDAAKKAHETEMAPWKEVLKVAEAEKASKTVAAINKIIKTKDDEFKKDLARLEKSSTTTGETPTKTGDATKSKP